MMRMFYVVAYQGNRTSTRCFEAYIRSQLGKVSKTGKSRVLQWAPDTDPVSFEDHYVPYCGTIPFKISDKVTMACESNHGPWCTRSTKSRFVYVIIMLKMDLYQISPASVVSLSSDVFPWPSKSSKRQLDRYMINNALMCQSYVLSHKLCDIKR